MENEAKNGAMPAKRAYRVKSPLRHNGKDYEVGKRISLDPKEAAAIGAHVLEPAKEEKAE